MSSLQGLPVCSVCGSERTQELPVGGDGRRLDCPRCGKFFISGSAAAIVEAWQIERRMNISGWVREQNILGASPEIYSNDLERLAAQPRPSFIELADKALLYAWRLEERRGAPISFDSPAFHALTRTVYKEELFQFTDYLADRDFIQVGNHGQINFRPDGYIHCEQLEARQPASAQGFVAMWFDRSMVDAWNAGFAPAIQTAGYDPQRVDGIEHNGKIDDLIIAEIRRSRFVVADFTGHRGGVYFEAGFAMGLNLPVIWTCRESDMGGLHFDIRQYNTIDWRDEADLAARLQRRIEAIIGDGPRKVLSAR